VGQQSKWEYFRAIYERYHKAGRQWKQAILNEFCLNTGYHRKYAIRLLAAGKRKQMQQERRGQSRSSHAPSRKSSG
jgi:hypothetical protein